MSKTKEMTLKFSRPAPGWSRERLAHPPGVEVSIVRARVTAEDAWVHVRISGDPGRVEKLIRQNARFAI